MCCVVFFDSDRDCIALECVNCQFVVVFVVSGVCVCVFVWGQICI